MVRGGRILELGAPDLICQLFDLQLIAEQVKTAKVIVPPEGLGRAPRLPERAGPGSVDRVRERSSRRIVFAMPRVLRGVLGCSVRALFFQLRMLPPSPSAALHSKN